MFLIVVEADLGDGGGANKSKYDVDCDNGDRYERSEEEGLRFVLKECLAQTEVFQCTLIGAITLVHSIPLSL